MTVVPLPPLQPPGKPAESEVEVARVSAGYSPARPKLPLRMRFLAGLMLLALTWTLFVGLVMGTLALFR